MVKSTKAKCEAFAKENSLKLEVEYYGKWFGYSYSITIPDDKILWDGCTGRSGLQLDIPKAEVWAMVMGDMEEIMSREWEDQ